MTNAEISTALERAIDQYYSQLKYTRKGYREKSEVYFIGGILKSGLFLLPTNEYYELKRYVYDNHGYDPGGVTDGQISMDDMEDE